MVIPPRSRRPARLLLAAIATLLVDSAIVPRTEAKPYSPAGREARDKKPTRGT
jgi:hypothetical protein